MPPARPVTEIVNDKQYTVKSACEFVPSTHESKDDSKRGCNRATLLNYVHSGRLKAIQFRPSTKSPDRIYYLIQGSELRRFLTEDFLAPPPKVRRQQECDRAAKRAKELGLGD